jgi:hypothetical protein
MLSGCAALAALEDVEEARRKLKNGMVLTLIFVSLSFGLGRRGVLKRQQYAFWRSGVQVLGKQTRQTAL